MRRTAWGNSLSLREGLDAGTQDLGEDGCVVKNQAYDNCLELPGGEHQQNEQHHEDHGHAAEELKDHLGRNADPRDQGNAQQAECDSQRECDDRGHGGGGQGGEDALADQVPNIRRHGTVEDLPTVGVEDSLLGQGCNGNGQDTEDDQDSCCRTDERVEAGLGPGDVVQDRGHRAIATFRSTKCARRPRGTVIRR